MNRLNIEKIIKFGQSIGATKVLLKNDHIYNYYKPGNKDSKHCMYAYTEFNNGRPEVWRNSYEMDAGRIAKFYSNQGHDIQLIDIPAPEEKDDEQS